MGAQDFEYIEVPLVGRKTGKLNTLMAAAPQLGLVPASRYNCDVKWSYHNPVSHFSSAPLINC